MRIILNGETKEIETEMTVAMLIKTFGYDGYVGAVAVNMTFVSSTRYGKILLKENDEVEILAPVYGG